MVEVVADGVRGDALADQQPLRELVQLGDLLVDGWQTIAQLAGLVGDLGRALGEGFLRRVELMGIVIGDNAVVAHELVARVAERKHLLGRVCRAHRPASWIVVGDGAVAALLLLLADAVVVVVMGDSLWSLVFLRDVWVLASRAHRSSLHSSQWYSAGCSSHWSHILVVVVLLLLLVLVVGHTTWACV